MNLTSRELEVIKLTAEGLCLKEIATQLGTAYATVNVQRQSAYRKLGIRNTAQASRWYYQVREREKREEVMG